MGSHSRRPHYTLFGQGFVADIGLLGKHVDSGWFACEQVERPPDLSTKWHPGCVVCRRRAAHLGTADLIALLA